MGLLGPNRLSLDEAYRDGGTGRYRCAGSSIPATGYIDDRHVELSCESSASEGVLNEDLQKSDHIDACRTGRTVGGHGLVINRYGDERVACRHKVARGQDRSCQWVISADLNLQGIREWRTRIQGVVPVSRTLMNQALDAGLRRAEVAIGKNGIVKKKLIYCWRGCGRATGDRRRIVALDVALKCRPPSAE
jgi:hypothetical protein